MCEHERMKGLTPGRVLLYGVLPFTGRVLDVATTIYSIGLGRRYVNGQSTECVETNDLTKQLMGAYPDYWHLIFLISSLIIFAVLLTTRWVASRTDLAKVRRLSHIFDLFAVAAVLLSFRPVITNLQTIHEWHTFVGGP